MKKNIQIIYISRSTFESSAPANKIEPNVARILAKSRNNNRKNGLVGVLYFGDGVFFQCLEGEESVVNSLMAKLAHDPRHKDLKILSKKPIDALSFGDWAMKFAPLDAQITKFLKENGFQTFNPYVFSDALTEQFLTMLFNAEASALEEKQVRPVAAVPQASKSLGESDIANKKANLALLCAVFAVVIALIALFKA